MDDSLFKTSASDVAGPKTTTGFGGGGGGMLIGMASGLFQKAAKGLFQKAANHFSES